jgi:flagellar protein FliL
MANPAPAAPETTDPDAPPPKKSRKLLFIAIGASVLLLAGGGAAWFLLKPSDDEKKAEAAEAEKHVEPVYVALDPAFVVNFEASGLVRFLQVGVQVMTKDLATAELLKRHDPVVRNGLLLLFSGQGYEKLSTTDGKEQLRQAALAEVRRIVAAQGGKADEPKDLYFTSFVMQ